MARGSKGDEEKGASCPAGKEVKKAIGLRDLGAREATGAVAFFHFFLFRKLGFAQYQPLTLLS
jgi:hypothetical protein